LICDSLAYTLVRLDQRWGTLVLPPTSGRTSGPIKKIWTHKVLKFQKDMAD